MEKLAVLALISTATIAAPLTTALAHDAYTNKRETRATYVSSNARYMPSHIHDHSSYHHPHVERRTHHHSHVQNNTYHYSHTHHYSNNHHHSHQYHPKPNHTSNALTAGIVGLATGAIIGNALRQPEPPRVIYQPALPPQQQVIYQPAQPSQRDAWLKYCTKKYRSFNPHTGTFRGYDGLDHVCYAPVH